MVFVIIYYPWRESLLVGYVRWGRSGEPAEGWVTNINNVALVQYQCSSQKNVVQLVNSTVNFIIQQAAHGHTLKNKQSGAPIKLKKVT